MIIRSTSICQQA